MADKPSSHVKPGTCYAIFSEAYPGTSRPGILLLASRPRVLAGPPYGLLTRLGEADLLGDEYPAFLLSAVKGDVVLKVVANGVGVQVGRTQEALLAAQVFPWFRSFASVLCSTRKSSPSISVHLFTVFPRIYVGSYEVQRKREVCTSLFASHA